MHASCAKVQKIILKDCTMTTVIYYDRGTPAIMVSEFRMHSTHMQTFLEYSGHANFLQQLACHHLYQEDGVGIWNNFMFISILPALRCSLGA